MPFKSYIVDAFTKARFGGNQAAVCLVDKVLENAEYQQIASEFNLSETVFPILLNPGDTFQTASRFRIRWFTPTVEVALCGHATLATSHVLFNEIGNKHDEIVFESLSGDLRVHRSDDCLTMNFPRFKEWVSFQSDRLTGSFPPMYEEEAAEGTIDKLVDIVAPSGKCRHIALAKEAKKLVVVLDENLSKEELLALHPNTEHMMAVHDGTLVRGVIVTLAPTDAAQQGFTDNLGRSYDYVSRYFAPWAGIREDPATGSSQCALGPFWSKAKNDAGPFYAFQCFPGRGAQFTVEFPDQDRINIYGNAVTVLRGELDC